jgi:hypothetical protein
LLRGHNGLARLARPARVSPGDRDRLVAWIRMIGEIATKPRPRGKEAGSFVAA